MNGNTARFRPQAQKLEPQDSAIHSVSQRIKLDNFQSVVVHRFCESCHYKELEVHINSPNLKSVAYKRLVRPLLEYSSAAWDPYTKENVKI